MPHDEPAIEKWPHPQGIEYAWVIGDRILGTVAPHGPEPGPKQPKRWRARVGRWTIGIYAGKRGRIAAVRAVKHFTKHLWCVMEVSA